MKIQSIAVVFTFNAASFVTAGSTYTVDDHITATSIDTNQAKDILALWTPLASAATSPMSITTTITTGTTEETSVVPTVTDLEAIYLDRAFQKSLEAVPTDPVALSDNWPHFTQEVNDCLAHKDQHPTGGSPQVQEVQDKISEFCRNAKDQANFGTFKSGAVRMGVSVAAVMAALIGIALL